MRNAETVDVEDIKAKKALILTGLKAALPFIDLKKKGLGGPGIGIGFGPVRLLSRPNSKL